MSVVRGTSDRTGAYNSVFTEKNKRKWSIEYFLLNSGFPVQHGWEDWTLSFCCWLRSIKRHTKTLFKDLDVRGLLIHDKWDRTDKFGLATGVSGHI